jgi:hypothetical protein
MLHLSEITGTDIAKCEEGFQIGFAIVREVIHTVEKELGADADRFQKFRVIGIGDSIGRLTTSFVGGAGVVMDTGEVLGFVCCHKSVGE